jgi:proton-dependent oligopeptide transporter, POT family
VATQPSKPVAPDGGRLPRQIKYIIGNEACERFSYYGVLGILELYLKNQMRLGDSGATAVLHYFGAAVYFLPLFGGWLADRFLGRYWTILSVSLFYCLGHGCLAAFGETRPGLFCGLALLAFGAGGIKPCVSAFVGDQLGASDERALTRVYAWFYWSINFGAAFAFFIIPMVARQAGYRWAFGIPGIFMAAATVIFWLGRKQYVRQPPARAAGSIGLWDIFRHGLARAGIVKSNLSPSQQNDARAVWRILMIFATVPMFWALWNQVDSTWVLQGNAMVPALRWGGQYLLNGETMQSAGAVLVMIWVPLLTLLVYPALEKWGLRPTALRRISAGMILAAVAFVGSGFLQAQLDRGAHLNIAWQLLPYIVLEAGEVLVSATGLEFAFSQAPLSMRSVITSFWLMTISVGHFLVAAFASLNENHIHARGAAQFYLFAAFMFVVAGVFMGCAAAYRPPQPAGGTTP